MFEYKKIVDEMLKQNGFEHQSLSYLEKDTKTPNTSATTTTSRFVFSNSCSPHTRKKRISNFGIRFIACSINPCAIMTAPISRKKSGRISRKFWKRASTTESTARQTSMRRCKRKDCISKGFNRIIWNLQKRMRKRISTTSADIISAKCKNAKLQVYRREVTV